MLLTVAGTPYPSSVVGSTVAWIPYPSRVVGSTVACTPKPSSVVGSTVAWIPKPSVVVASTGVRAVEGPVGATKAAVPDPVVAAVADAVGLVPNKPPTVAEKLVNSELSPDPPPVPPPSNPPNSPLIVPRAPSILGKPVFRLPNPKPLVAMSVESGSCGMPSLARI